MGKKNSQRRKRRIKGTRFTGTPNQRRWKSIVASILRRVSQ